MPNISEATLAVINEEYLPSTNRFDPNRHTAGESLQWLGALSLVPYFGPKLKDRPLH